ncbi:MAG: hypothetical protein M3R70_09630 [Actinomycetota bacterium]|nr:hypothetical protein [Actinomycetota bacterium]
MTETNKLESLLAGANGGEIAIPRSDAQELAQKLRARGGGGALKTLEHRLGGGGDEVTLGGGEAHALLEELRASGRKWVSGGDTNPPTFGREQPPEPPEPLPEQAKPKRSGLGRFFSRE